MKLQIKTITAIFLILVFSQYLKSQDSPFYQVSGTVWDEYDTPLDFVHVININLSKAAITDLNGRFSIVCTKYDTLMFSSVGYKKKYITLPDSATSQFVFHDILLERDTLQIKEVKIFPWKTLSIHSLKNRFTLLRVQIFTIVIRITYSWPG